jgi:hypothetical protein
LRHPTQVLCHAALRRMGQVECVTKPKAELGFVADHSASPHLIM